MTIPSAPSRDTRSDKTRNDMLHITLQVAVEFIGTFVFLTAIIALVFDSKKKSYSPIIAPLGIGIALAAVIFAFGSVSGGHFNPAVTLADITYHGFQYKFIFYMLAQFAAAVLAVLLVKRLYE